jgi:hypothetical protein
MEWYGPVLLTDWSHQVLKLKWAALALYTRWLKPLLCSGVAPVAFV